MYLSILAAVIAVAGCRKCHDLTSAGTLNTKAVTNKVANAETAIRLAGAEARSRGWTKVTLGKVDETDIGWDVYIFNEPPMPGGHAIVRVSKDGNKVEFQGGM